MNKIILLIIASINLTSSAHSQFRKYVFCGYDVWIRKHDKNQKNVLEVLQTVKTHGLVNIDDESSSSSSSSSFDSDDSLHSNHLEEEIQEMPPLFTPLLKFQSQTSSIKDHLTAWSSETGSIFPRSPQTPSLQRLTRKITKKELITSNNSNNRTTTKQISNQKRLYFGDSITSFDDYRYSDLTPSDHSLFPPKTPLLQKLKTTNNVLQNDINQKTTKIKQLEEELQNEIDKKIKEIGNIRHFYLQRQEVLMDENEELQNEIQELLQSKFWGSISHSSINSDELSQIQSVPDVQLLSLKTINNILQNEINNKTTKIKQMEGKQEINTEKIHKLRNYIEKLQNRIVSIHDFYQEHQVKTERGSISKTERGSVEEQVISLKTTNNVLQNDINHKTIEIKRLKEELQNETDENYFYQEHQEVVLKEVISSKISAQKQLISLKTTNNVLQNEINNKTTKIKQMEGKQEINTEKIHKLMNYIEKLQKKVYVPKSIDYDYRCNDLSDVNKSSKISVQEQLILLKTTNNILQNEINNKTTKIKEMEEDHLNELKIKILIIQKLINHNEKQQNEIKEKSKEIVVCRLIIDEQQMNITKMENDNRENEEYQQELINEINELQNKVERKEKDILNSFF